jgi:glycosyltransferase involved in cell wall biosynthesis
MSTVSVVIPTYNASPFIREALASVFAQTRLPDEVIVVDDCSPDDTVAVVEQIAANAPIPVRVIRLSKNSGGPAAPIEYGVRHATGDFIAVLDQDDIFCQEKLLREAEILAKRPDVRLVFARTSLTSQPMVSLQSSQLIDEITACGTPCDSFIMLPGEQLLALLIKEGNFIIGFPGFMFRRSEAADGPLLDSELRIAADYDFLCRLCGGNAAFIDAIHYHRREHDSNVCRRREEMFQEIAIVRARYGTDPRLRRAGLRCPSIRQTYFDIAYKCRNQGQYRTAAWWLWISMLYWGPRPRTLFGLGKLLPHMVWTHWRSIRRPSELR